MAVSQVIILNGVSSVGKSSTARALQTLTRKPFLHVPMDAFIGMLPHALIGRPEGLMFETTQEDGKSSVNIIVGPVLARVMRGMHHAVAAMAAQGNNLIIDLVLMELTDEQACRELLSAFEVYFVGLFASLEVIEERERRRDDRKVGLARWQQTRLHRDTVYDLTINVSHTTPMQNAERIRARFDL